MSTPAEEAAAATFDLLKVAHGLAIDASKSLRFEGSHKLHVHCIALYGTILELSNSVINLIGLGDKTAAAIVLRTVFEASVDLSNIIREPKVGHSLELMAKMQSEKFLKALLDPNNPETVQANAERIKRDLRDVQKKIQSAKAKGGVYLSIRQRCRLLGTDHYYTGLYAVLCGEAHNHLPTLLHRHVSEKDGVFQFDYFRHSEADDLEPIAGITTAIVVRATKDIHQLLGNPAAKLVDELVSKYDKVYAEREALELAEPPKLADPAAQPFSHPSGT